VKNIEIRPKFQNLIPRLAAHELAKLETSIIAEGIREPLTIGVIEEVNVHASPRPPGSRGGHHRTRSQKSMGCHPHPRD